MKPTFEIVKIENPSRDFCNFCDGLMHHDHIWELHLNLGSCAHVFNLCEKHVQELTTTLEKKEG